MTSSVDFAVSILASGGRATAKVARQSAIHGFLAVT